MAKQSGSEKPWERQPGESTQAYGAFDAYLKMGDERSIRKVAQKLNKSDALIGRWSSAWHWQKRIRDYENELNRKEFEEEQKELKKMRKRQSQIAQMMQSKALKALEKLDVETLSPNEILRFITEGSKLERENREASVRDREENGANIEYEDLEEVEEEIYGE